MSKQNIVLCLLMTCITTTSLFATPETRRKKPTATQKEEVEEEKPLEEDERDSMLLLSGIGILGSVISMFIDRHNLPHIKTQLFALLAGIQQFVQIMIRSPYRFATQEELVEVLLAYLEKEGLL